ncbi:hypothetical protein QTO34_000486 [Cnephaeus nilssonii]|uniref:DNA helicase Pif1-like 2B domain-containing protein n=1 Tax=Cnephaeus nilssonii TaxID=3371016 RepID=A0AA40ICD7_CNENI|nr:hypothetical protein QTO34_000486 [Eptesicus nilssonii]
MAREQTGVLSRDDAEKENFPIKFLNSITPSEMPCHKLKLKVGAIIMLLRNLNNKWGFCNGTRFIIKRLRPNIIEAELFRFPILAITRKLKLLFAWTWAVCCGDFAPP